MNIKCDENRNHGKLKIYFLLVELKVQILSKYVSDPKILKMWTIMCQNIKLVPKMNQDLILDLKLKRNHFFLKYFQKNEKNIQKK